MKISRIGEFGLIDRIKRRPRDKNILVGIGDDAAVVRIGKKLAVFTTDTLVEGDHFSLDYFTPEQIGMKAVEINVSDIGSMGGFPKYALVSLALRKGMDVEFVERLYRGIRAAASKYGLELIGGNMTHAKQVVLNLDVIGFVQKSDLKLRSSAKPGDFILVSGYLGGSTAGLNLFKKKVKGFHKVKKYHTEPHAGFHKVKHCFKYVNAMMDISDGLASEIAHICKQSKTGAIIYADNVPIRDEVRAAAEAVGKSALDFAMYGGEDFELVYTVPEKNLDKVQGFLVGEITRQKGVRMYHKGRVSKTAQHGYDHFR